ncbi:hypothetical protein NL676_034712 [Syzygium grande]|nr:hypothetical protein NL676_034712 [Syzygium grande]
MAVSSSAWTPLANGMAVSTAIISAALALKLSVLSISELAKGNKMTFLNLVMAVSVAPSMSMAGFRPPEKEDDGDDESWPASSAAVGGGRRHLYEILDALYASGGHLS